MIVSAIPAFDDNYIWAIQPSETNGVIVVDPGAAEPVLDWLTQHHKKLLGILVTHHHWDHTTVSCHWLIYFKCQSLVPMAITSKVSVTLLPMAILSLCLVRTVNSKY